MAGRALQTDGPAGPKAGYRKALGGSEDQGTHVVERGGQK